MSEHHDSPKAHDAHAIHEEHAAKGPHDLKEINPKMSSDIAYWSKEFGVTGDKLHEAIRSHGTHVEKIRAASEARRDPDFMINLLIGPQILPALLGQDSSVGSAARLFDFVIRTISR